MEATRPRRLGKYDLLARIAKGGMAEIYLARQHGMVGFARLVVVKRILPHLAEEPEFVRMFMEEARLAALINHPNVVQIYDVGQFEGSYYIAMEYINGLSLGAISRHARKAQAPLAYPVAAEIVAQACDGLHAAHELVEEDGRPLNLVHRDVSPHNLMITREGLVKLVDFGIAKAQDTSIKTHTGKIKGKYPYMSPEQCRGDPLDRRTDIFSLGIVLHELVVGQRLFQRGTDLMVLKAITEEPIPCARDLNPALPEEIDRIIHRSLKRFPDERFASAAEMGKEIRRVLKQLEVPSSPELLGKHIQTQYPELLDGRAKLLDQVLQARISGVTPPVVDGFDDGISRSSAGSLAMPISRRVTRVPRRRPWLLALLALCVVVLAAGSGLLYRHLRQPARPGGPPIYFGLPPSFPSRVAQTELGPFVAYLERQVGRRVELAVTKDYETLRQGLLSGRIHFANLPPLQFVLARKESPRLEVLVSQTYEKAHRYQAYLVVREDSPVSSVAELKNKRICYVDKGSGSGYLLPRHFLRGQGLSPDEDLAARFSGNHVSVMNDLLAGRCDVGAIYSGAMISAAALGVASSRIRILGVTGQLPYDVICAAPQIERRLAGNLRAALLAMRPQRDLGRPVVGPTYRIDGFVAPRLEEFVTLEQAARAEGLLR